MRLAYVPALGSFLKLPWHTLFSSQGGDVKSPLYRARYAGELVRGLLRPHRPRLPGALEPVMAKVRFKERDRADWQQFVGKAAHHLPAPLTYYNHAGALCFFKILADLRINFATVVHLRAALELTAPLEAVTPEGTYTLNMALTDLIPRKGQCILEMTSDILDERQEVVRRHKDYWFIKRCPAQFLKQVQSKHPELAQDFLGLSQRKAQWPSWQPEHVTVRPHRLQPSAGKDYGRISGDRNVLHSTHWGARLCGQRGAFLQGFGLLNLALHHATQARSQAPQTIVINFARPALLDQQINFYFGPEAFEVCDAGNQLIAFGQLS